jgi:GAF domain-containing protein
MKTFAPPRESGEFTRPGLGFGRRPTEATPRVLETISERSLEAILCAIPEEFVEALGARAVSVYALSNDRRTLQLVAQAGVELLVKPTRKLDVDDALPAARAVRQRTMQVVGECLDANAEVDPLASPAIDEAMLFSVPLVGAQRVFAVVNIEFGSSPGPDDVREIGILGELFGAALELVLLRSRRAESGVRQAQHSSGR